MTKRLLELEPTSLFGDEAILTHLSGREELSRPFDFMLSIASTNEKIKPEQIIGQPLAVRIHRDDEEPRYIHGYVSSFWAGDTFAPENGKKPFRMYRVRIVPWLWFTSRASRCFIYHPEKAEKSIQDVLDAVVKRVKEYGHVVPELESANAKILGKRKVEHCVQYRETDFNFLSRTLERYGIFYYFKFANNKHTLILSDQLNYPNAPEAEVKYPHSSDTRGREDIITSWEHAYEFVTGKWEQTDYDFIHPSTDLKVNAQKHSSITLKNNDAYEYYEYPGEYIKKDDGEAEASVRLEAEETRFNTVTGSSHCKTFSPGYCFKLTEHLNCKDEKGKAYLLTSVVHSASQPGPFTSETQAAIYSNSFTCIPRDSQYRPPRSTPQPLLSSVQTAVVVGPLGEEIYTDQYGRVKVQFHWDREGNKDENTSCWVRVSQEWAGKGWGGMKIPRVGHEVIVNFLEGDPDQPIIVGSVYNAENMPHYDLPKYKTLSYIKTHSTPKAQGFNELRFEDKAKKEQVFIHSQKRYDLRARGSMYETCGGSRQEVIGLKDPGNPGGNLTVTVAGCHDFHIKEAEYIGVDQKLNEAVKGEVVEDYQSSLFTMVGTKSSLNAQEIIMEAKTKISLKVGASCIVIEPSLITIAAAMVKINSGGFGVETGDPVIDDPLDAELSDNGEPGYLDRPRTGGGRGGRNRRQLKSQHHAYPPRPGEDAKMTAIRNKLKDSATGRRALEIYERYGVKSTFNTGVGGGYEDDSNSMNLDPAWGDFNNTAFVHEMHHAQMNNEHTSADIKNQSKPDYVDTLMKEESTADALANQTAKELKDAGKPQTNQPPNNASYDAGYKKGVDAAKAANPNASPEELDAAGKKEAQKQVYEDYKNGKVTPSDIGGVKQPPYPQYYGNAWDANHPGGK